MDDLEGFVADDELAYEPLAALGWSVESLSWTSEVADWGAFDLAVIRTTWDYYLDPAAFIRVLETIHETGCRLENDLELVRWNLDKRYLFDLEASGVPIVRTILGHQIGHRALNSLFRELDCTELVLKPAVSASAHNTFRLTLSAGEVAVGRAIDALQGQVYLAQAFEEQIILEGEFSLFFFNGEYSHAILKTPKHDDFRVQEEHGGLIRLTEPTPVLMKRALQALSALDTRPLYARVDLVRLPGKQQDFALMELELVEPALYFRMDPLSPGRFARALDTRIRA
jgi:hypothetical protein